MPTQHVLRVTGPITLDWGNGMRLTLSPSALSTTGVAGKAKGRPGRKPGPATQALVAAMEADGARPRSRLDYLRILRDAGHKGSDNSAALIMNREAKRMFGRPLGRATARRPTGRRGGGRLASPATSLLRDKLATDKGQGTLRNAKHYVRWLVDQPNVKLGLKQVRPIVYRELRAVR
jgi:hypothetical protein